MRGDISFQRLQNLREEILQLGMYLGGYEAPRKNSNKETLDLLWNSRILAFEETNKFSNTRVYLRSLYKEWESIRGFLAERYIYLVKQMARKYGHSALEQRDFFQEGAMGLLRGIDSYEVEYGVPFEAFARFWIRKYLSHMIAVGDLVRVPGDSSASYDSTVENIADGCCESASDRFMRDTMECCLNKCLASLNSAQREILNLRYLSDESRLLTLDEVSRKLGCSRESVRTLECRGLKRLKCMLNS